jgi:hypothetical protein
MSVSVKIYAVSGAIRRMGMAKAKSIYIFGAEPQSGKWVVLLGIIELFYRRSRKINVI